MDNEPMPRSSRGHPRGRRVRQSAKALSVEPYGSWKSEITPERIVAGSGAARVQEVQVAGGRLYWIEHRGERDAIVRLGDAGGVREINDLESSCGNWVQSSGGGSYSVAADGTVFYSNLNDGGRIYRANRWQPDAPVSAPYSNLRYADLIVDSQRDRLICVGEFSVQNSPHPVNCIFEIPLATGVPEILVSGNDFYMNPRLSPDGNQLSWITWNHPNRPWDGNDLIVAELSGDGAIVNTEHIAGSATESICQPEWSADGDLYFVSDADGWWNIYRRHDHQVAAVTADRAEYGVPQTSFGRTTYDFLNNHEIAAIVKTDGGPELRIIDVDTKAQRSVPLPYTDFDSCLRVHNGKVVVIGSSTTQPTQFAEVDPTTGQIEVIRGRRTSTPSHQFLSTPERIEFPTSGGKTAFGLYYAPKNPRFTAPKGERPPLLVMAHGGPSDAYASSAYSLSKQYWTSRGIAVLDVDYGGGIGHGREFRERLRGQWGVVDVQDCINGAKYLVAQGLADPARLLISGFSSGGYTALAAVTFEDFFAAASSQCGVSDLTSLVANIRQDKFMCYLLDGLVGPYPQEANRYRERSPLLHAGNINVPVAIFQGMSDGVVPPDQAQAIAKDLRQRKAPYYARYFIDEGHGWRTLSTFREAIESELSFFGQVCGFEPQGVPRIIVNNLEAAQDLRGTGDGPAVA